MHRLVLRVVELAVPNSGPGGHALHIAGANDGAGSHAVLVLQRAFEDIGDDLHVLVPVRLETATWLNAILVDHAQDAEAHMLRIIVLAEGEGMPAVEPTEIGCAARFGGTESDGHGLGLLQDGHPNTRRSLLAQISRPIRASSEKR